jgi:hypothetical protein
VTVSVVAYFTATSQHLDVGSEKNHKKTVKIIHVPGEIRSEHDPNVAMSEVWCYVNQLRHNKIDEVMKQVT